MGDWYEGMAAKPNEIIAYFQLQMRIRRVYDGPVDGVVNPQIKEAVARYREALGLSHEPKLTFDFFKGYLTAKHEELASRIVPVPAAAAEPSSAPVAAAGAASAAAAATAPLALQLGTLDNVRSFEIGRASCRERVEI